MFNSYGANRDIFTRHDEEIILAGPKGTGKSLAWLHKLNLVALKYPMCKLAMCRKTRESMTNSCVDMFERFVLKPTDRVIHHKQDAQFQYPNGSIIATIGLDKPLKLQSSEWDIIYIQEATEVSEDDWEMCTGLLRSGVVPYQQLGGDCNPDKPTHWLKKRCDQGKTVMLRSFHEDNPKYYNHRIKKPTTLGEKYFGKLSRLSGHRRSRLYLGKWTAAEGMVYETWDPNLHLVNRVDMPKDYVKWAHYWSIDWGHVHPFVWQDWIEHPDTGDLYLNAEIYRTGWLVEDMARYIKKKTDGMYVPRAIICDHDLEDRKVFERHTQLLTLPAYKFIQPGVQAVQARLGKPKDEKGLEVKPRIFLIRDCLLEPDKGLIEDGKPYSTEQEIDGYVWDKKHNLEVNSKRDELPIDKDNHGMDALRYIVAFIDNLAEDPEEFSGVVELGQEEIISLY